jgi:hypothetical protein
MKSLPSLLFAVAALTSSLVVAAPAPTVPVATFRADPAEFRGDSTTLRVRIMIPPGWHIQSDAPLDDFLIPTEVKAAAEGLRFGKPVFPRALTKDLPALGGKVALFEDTIEVRLPVKREAKAGTSADAKAMLRNAAVTVRYQSCNDSQCLPPRTIPAKYWDR